MEYEIEMDREDDGAWIASIPSMPGVMAYGQTSSHARQNVKELAVRVELAQLKRDLQDRDNHIELAYSELGKFNRSIYLFDYIREFKHENNKLAECLELAIDELKDIRNQSGYPYGIEDVLKDIERIKQG